MKRKRDEGVVVNVNTDNKRRKVQGRTFTPKSSSMDIEPSSRQGYYTVARTRGVYAKGEMKYYDSGKASSLITPSADWTGTEYDPATRDTLCCPKQGPAINQRIGREINIHKIKVRGSILCQYRYNQVFDSVFSAPIVRLVLYVDNQTNSAQSQGEQVFSGNGISPSVFAYQNIDNFGRFKVLKDKLLCPPVNSANYPASDKLDTPPSRIPFKWNINLKTPIKVRFNNTDGETVADIVDNSLHIIANCAGTTPPVYIQYTSRVCYKDT